MSDEEKAVQQEQPAEVDASKEPAEKAGEEVAKPSEFKSPESKDAVLADLMKAREELKRYKEAEEQREREKLSDIERAKAEAEDFRKRWESAEQARIRSEVARSKGVDPELLNGGTEEEMRAHAERLLAWRGDKPVVTNPNPAQGAGEKPVASEDDKTFFEALGRTPSGI